MWVYPNQVIQNDNWTTNTGVGILLALGENDGLYIYNTSPINLLHLGMPSEVVNCEVRVQSDGMNPPLLLNFYRAGNPIDSVSVPTTNNWETHTLTVDRWDSVELLVGIGGTVGVDFLRAEPYGGAPTKRTLTGVGI
jgi:hypothetical protein